MLIHSDGFDSHATGTPELALGDSGWGTGYSVSIVETGGRFGGKALHKALGANAAQYIQTAGDYSAVAAWFKVGPSTTATLLLFDESNALLERGNDGSLTVQDGSGATRITMPAATLPQDVWKWIEVSFRTDGIYLNIDGAPVGSYVGAYTQPAWSSLHLFGGGPGESETYVDDLIVWDDTGADFNTYGLAPRRIHFLRPDADGSLVQWTPAGATNWQSVDAADWTGGAGVSATTVGQTDRYSFEDLGSLPGSIDAVVVKARVENTGTSDATVATVSHDGTAGAEGVGVLIPPENAATIRGTFYRNPTGTAWTPSNVNSNQFGQKLNV